MQAAWQAVNPMFAQSQMVWFKVPSMLHYWPKPMVPEVLQSLDQFRKADIAVHSLQTIGNYVHMGAAEKNMALIQVMSTRLHKFRGISAFVGNMERETVMQALVEVSK